MAKDILFLLKPGFADLKLGPQGFFCPPCMAVKGMLSVFPDLVEKLDIREVDFPRPRPLVVELLGQENQGCPVLILAEKPDFKGAFTIKEYQGRLFIDEALGIQDYLALKHNVARPHR